MNLNVFTTYSPYVQAYDLPNTMNCKPEDIVETYRRMISQNPDMAFQNFLHEKKLVLLGQYDDVSGKLIPVEQPVVIADLAGFFPKGFIEKRQADTVKYFAGGQKNA